MRFYIVFLVVATFSYVHAQNWRTLDSLCYEYAETNPDSAIIYGKKAIQGCVKEKGKNSIEYAVCLEHIAWAYKSKDNLKVSDSLYKEAVFYIKKSNSTQTNDYADILNNWALVDIANTKYQPALDKINEGIKIKENLNIPLEDILPLYNNVGFCYEKLEFLDDAEKQYKKVLELKEKILGKESISYFVTLNNLAQVYLNIGDYSQSGTDFY